MLAGRVFTELTHKPMPRPRFDCLALRQAVVWPEDEMLRSMSTGGGAVSS
jgi:hypothetical protein